MNRFVYIAIAVLIALAACSCSTIRYVEVPTVKVVHDTITESVTLRDSIHVVDHIYTQGDSVYRDRWHYIERRSTDTVFIAREVPVEVAKPYEVVVEKPLAWWQRLLQWVGGVCLLLLALKVGYSLRR